MTSLVERLRKTGHIDYALLDQAADRIEELERKLNMLCDHAENVVLTQHDDRLGCSIERLDAAIENARAALSDSSPTLLQEQKDNAGKEWE